ncbi:MAG TPA: CBS domain-containing protein, partial [Chitinophagales bacterium]|nr:CBS domain-containing protein [Chitinophagales bacterium]
ACQKLTEFNISQIPVTDGKGNFVGSINDTHLYAKLVSDPKLKKEKISAVAQAPFPVIGSEESIESISKKINKDNNAVIVNDKGGNVHIITKYDIIDALSH